MARSNWSMAFSLLAGISRSDSAIEPLSAGVIWESKSRTPIGRDRPGALARKLAGTANVRATKVAMSLERDRSKRLVLNNFNYDPAGRSVTAFRGDCLARPWIAAGAIRSPTSAG